jgi:hypothetical protein
MPKILSGRWIAQQLDQRGARNAMPPDGDCSHDGECSTRRMTVCADCGEASDSDGHYYASAAGFTADR